MQFRGANRAQNRAQFVARNVRYVAQRLTVMSPISTQRVLAQYSTPSPTTGYLPGTGLFCRWRLL